MFRWTLVPSRGCTLPNVIISNILEFFSPSHSLFLYFFHSFSLFLFSPLSPLVYLPSLFLSSSLSVYVSVFIFISHLSLFAPCILSLYPSSGLLSAFLFLRYLLFYCSVSSSFQPPFSFLSPLTLSLPVFLFHILPTSSHLFSLLSTSPFPSSSSSPPACPSPLSLFLFLSLPVSRFYSVSAIAEVK